MRTWDFLTQFSDPLDIMGTWLLWLRQELQVKWEDSDPGFPRSHGSQLSLLEAGNCKLLWLSYDCVSCTGSQLTMAVLRKQTQHISSLVCLGAF